MYFTVKTKAYNVIISHTVQLWLLFKEDFVFVFVWILLLSSTTSLQSWGRFLWATQYVCICMYVCSVCVISCTVYTRCTPIMAECSVNGVALRKRWQMDCRVLDITWTCKSHQLSQQTHTQPQLSYGRLYQICYPQMFPRKHWRPLAWYVTVYIVAFSL